MREVKFDPSKGSLVPATIYPCFLKEKPDSHHSPDRQPTLSLYYLWTKSRKRHEPREGSRQHSSELLSTLFGILSPSEAKN